MESGNDVWEMNGGGAGASASAPVQVFRVPTRDQVRQRRAEETEGYWFPLFRTGGAARVRIPSLSDRATIKAMPSSMQSLFAETVTKNRGTVKRVSGREAVEKVEADLADQEVLANAMCVVSFLQPRLVSSEEELDPSDPYCWLVTDLHIDERTAFLNLVMKQEEGEAHRL